MEYILVKQNAVSDHALSGLSVGSFLPMRYPEAVFRGVQDYKSHERGKEYEY